MERCVLFLDMEELHVFTASLSTSSTAPNDSKTGLCENRIRLWQDSVLYKMAFLQV